MIDTVNLVSIHPSSPIRKKGWRGKKKKNGVFLFPLFMRAFRISSLSNFEINHTAVLTIVRRQIFIILQLERLMPHHFGKHLKIWKEFTPTCQVGINENFIKCKWKKNGIRNGYKSKKGLNIHNYLSRPRVGKIAWASLPAKTAFRS